MYFKAEKNNIKIIVKNNITKITSEISFYRKKKENLFQQSFKKKMSPSKQTERLAWLLRAGENKGCCMTTNDSPTPIIPPQHSYLLLQLHKALIHHSAQLKEASGSKQASPGCTFIFNLSQPFWRLFHVLIPSYSQHGNSTVKPNNTVESTNLRRGKWNRSNIISIIKPKQSSWQNSGEKNAVMSTCRLVRGSIFMTGPTVLRGRVTSTLWFGVRGVRTCRGPAGARPKLHRSRGKETEKKTTKIWNKDITCKRIYLFLLNWMAKSPMGLIALLVRVISIWMTPARRAKVPDISRPLAFMAGSQTCTLDMRQISPC